MDPRPSTLDPSITEAIRPVPGQDRASHEREINIRVEPGELPSPAREHASSCSINVVKVDGAMPEGGIVARARQVEDNVTIENTPGASGAGIGHRRAYLDLLEGGGRDGADVIGLPSVRRALLLHMENPASRERGWSKLQSRYLHAAATAYLALARADSVGALGLFRSIPDTLCLENDCFYEKLIEARLLTSRGQARQAGVVLDRWVWSGRDPLFVLGILERGRIAERLGERQKAGDAYQFVVDVWRHADPELEPYVREARSGLERLAAEGGAH
jgi:hypothetical protein